MKGLSALDKKATHVVLEVRNMVLAALLRVYAILFSFIFKSGIYALYLQASQRTKKSSAAIPKIMNMISV